VAGLLAALLSLALVAPVLAEKRDKSDDHGLKACTPKLKDYRASGTLVSSALSANPDGSFSGSLTVSVLRTNRHARADQGTTKTYTLDHAKVKFGKGVNPAAPAAGSRAKLKGTITELPKRCPPAGFTPTLTVTKVKLSVPRGPERD
jgi:hypothetical protein